MAPAIGLYLELWLGNARSPDQALSPRPAEGNPLASVARSGEAGPQLPTPLRRAGRAEGRIRRSSTPPPLARRAHSWGHPRAPLLSPPAHLRPAGLVAASSHGRARHQLQEET